MPLTEFQKFIVEIHGSIDAPESAKAVSHGFDLCSRLSEAKVIEFRDGAIDGWTPSAQYCHNNVAYWVSKNHGHKAVHGWLHMDLRPLLPCHRFLAHSVISDEKGVLFDITPMKAPSGQKYPFLAANLSDEDFEEILASLREQLGPTYLHHYPE